MPILGHSEPLCDRGANLPRICGTNGRTNAAVAAGAVGAAVVTAAAEMAATAANI